MRKTALIFLGLLLASCGPAENAKLPGAAAAGSTGGSTGGTGGNSPTGGTGGTAGKGGSGGATNPFAGNGGGGSGGKAGSGGAGSGGRAGSGGTAGGGSGGGGSAGGGSSGGSGGSTTSKLDGSGIPDIAIPTGVAEPCSPPKDLSEGQTGRFGTTGTFCFRTCDEIEGWGCSSFDGRTVKVNGQAIKCGDKLPAKAGPFYYFEASAGAYDYAAIYWWGKMYGVPAGGFKPWGGSSTPTSTTTASATSTTTASTTTTSTTTTSTTTTSTTTASATSTTTDSATSTATDSGT